MPQPAFTLDPTSLAATSATSALLYALFPIAAVLIGGAVSIFYIPKPTVQSGIQHFAGGVVFAAVAVELLPDIMRMRAELPVVIGFALGVAVMLAVRALAERLEPAGEEGTTGQPRALIAAQPRQGLPVGLLAAVGIDLLLDGLLVGVAFAAGAEAGVLITLALTLEVLFLSLSTAVQVRKTLPGRRQVLLSVVGLALLLGGGALVGTLLLGGLSGAALDVVLSFGLAALLYLVIEELLVDAHEVPETMLTTTMFFAGFLVLLVITLFSEG